MQILETITDYTDTPLFSLQHENNSIGGCPNYADFRDYVENSFITNYADYDDIQYYMKNNSITDNGNYADFE